MPNERGNDHGTRREGNETNRHALRNYQLMLEYFRDLAKRSADAKEMERYWAFLKAA
jgi:hypothetical protein